jgi:hypothetical protein
MRGVPNDSGRATLIIKETWKTNLRSPRAREAIEVSRRSRLGGISMSRLTVVRRLTAVIALLAVLCLALPAVAAPRAHGSSHRTHAVHAPSLVDQLVAWIGSFWTGPSQPAPAEKTISVAPSGNGTRNFTTTTSSEAGGMIDPNG